MAYNFKNVERETPYLMPPSLTEWLPEGHLAWFIVETVKTLKLSKFREKYREDGWGGSAYDPELLVGLMLYAYCIGERSSRQIEKKCAEDIAFRVLMANAIPDYSTICRFRAKHEEELRGVFQEALRMCRSAGLVKAGTVALDGTKIKASASKSANRGYDHLKEEVDRIFEEAKSRDAQEDELYGKDKRGDEWPEHLNTLEKQKKWIAEEMGRINRQAQEETRKYQERILQRHAQEVASGKKLRGRKPGRPEAVGEEKINTSDPESRLMKTREGYVQGYNAQAVVTREQIIVAAEVTQEANDIGQLHPMLEKAQEELKAAGSGEKIKRALADAGYWSDGNATKMRKGLELLVATNKDWKQRKAMREAPAPRGRMRKGMTARDLMERKLLTKRGRALYKLRGQTVEPVFGQVKDGRGFDRFMRRGKQAARSEWSLICATHNLLKLWRSGKAKLGRILKQARPEMPTFVPVYA
jgi:transposase